MSTPVKANKGGRPPGSSKKQQELKRQREEAFVLRQI